LFGYIKPCKPELKIHEFESYKAVYCGLCRQLGRSYGAFARLTLSYDFTSLCMMGSALTDEAASFESCRCCVNPLKKVRMGKALCGENHDDILHFGADIAALMIYYKLLDNIQDSGFWKRCGYKILKPIAAKARKKAAAARPEADQRIARFVERQRQVELAGSDSIDEAAEPSAEAMAFLFMLLAKKESDRRILERLGYLIGRYVYLCDALDDLEDDEKSGNYNPFLRKYDHENPEQRRLVREEAKQSLYLTVGEIAKANDLLTLYKFEPILHNIAHLGLRAGVEEILHKKERLHDRSI
jgi:hypothetical protein